MSLKTKNKSSKYSAIALSNEKMSIKQGKKADMFLKWSCYLISRENQINFFLQHFFHYFIVWRF